MPPPGYFTSPDRYCRKHWRRVQNLSNKFWNQWRKKVLLTLQNRGKSTKQQRNRKVGDVDLLREDSERNRQSIVQVVFVNSDSKGDVRSVRILVDTRILDNLTSTEDYSEEMRKNLTLKMFMIISSIVTFLNKYFQSSMFVPYYSLIQIQ